MRPERSDSVALIFRNAELVRRDHGAFSRQVQTLIAKDRLLSRLNGESLADFLERYAPGEYVPIKGSDWHFSPVSESCQCDCCGHFVESGDETEIITRRGTRLYCDDCRDSEAFHCGLSDEYWLAREYTERTFADSGETFCLEHADDNGFDYWISDDGDYYSDPDNMPDNTPALPDPHNHSFTGRADKYGSRNIAGVELEMESHSTDDRDEIAAAADNVGLAYCSDGSLSEDGIEIVGPPLSHSSTIGEDSPWRAIIDCAKRRANAWDAGEDVGMHVSLNKGSVSGVTVAKINYFVNAIENREFIESIAGRAGSRWCVVTHKKLSRDLIAENNKYTGLHIKGGRLEFRIFRSTLRIDSFLKNVEFCFALREFCQQSGMQFLNKISFITWIQEKGNAGRYRYLMTWLREHGFIQLPLPFRELSRA